MAVGTLKGHVTVVARKVVCIDRDVALNAEVATAIETSVKADSVYSEIQEQRMATAFVALLEHVE